jgi:ABC-type nickel/cobalt efflux system permease component RcnA
VYARRLVGSVTGAGRLVRIVPVMSALVIACVGAAICYGALAQAGVDLSAVLRYLHESADTPSFQGVSALGVLGLGLVFGLKHATEADHVVAVSTMVSEHKNLARAALVGGLWGLGHTASLVVVGALVLALRIAIPEYVASWLEFGVALMIIALGATALVRGLRRRSDVHIHRHEHGGSEHAHIHFHETDTEHTTGVRAHSHEVRRVGFKPLVVGAMHGLAGSAALTLLVLTQIGSAALGLLYLAVFGVGSIGGMLLMSGLVGLPFAFTSNRLGRFHHVLQIAAGAFSLAFGVWYAYESGAATGILFAITP